ncbi:hypothetical protein Vadar_003383 [Vaccinium darrowii]|uniref:Uncharacterized protein n=1 Tax=Vaccinium darrowii TaxID=229202 RepID=A0ACB7ZH10_9ERIC|nr:hypothetical protein Vadar_003383 [Vaccinium darrowii]
MADELSRSVKLGLNLSKRIYYGKDKYLWPPKPEVAMERSESTLLLPTAPMVYAVISEPSIVDNPDVPSYQPYVHGRCEPPALIPLHMYGITVEVDCYLDTAFVTVSGKWRVHCVMAGKSCDCRIGIPMGEQGSVLGVEVDDGRRSYQTQLTTLEDTKDAEKAVKAKDGFLLKRRIFTVKVPQVEGGSNLFMKVSWSQKLLYQDGQFCLSLPFSFPAYVIPVGKKTIKREKIVLNLNPGTGTQVLLRSSSHRLQELTRQVGKLGFLYEAQVSSWSSSDFFFSYDVSSSDISGGLLLQSASLHDIDQREMFSFYIFPGNGQRRKVFRKEVVFLVDVSGSMKEGPLENAKIALLEVLSKLSPLDSFNIIAFNESTQSFSSLMELATKEAIENATQWISRNFIAEGGTNILLPLNQALEMLAKTSESVPLIFLITDGAVEDERHICSEVKSCLSNGRPICPRISTFGIGSYCNHYFLQMLAEIGRGYYDAAYDVDSINLQIQRLFNTASSSILANISIDAFECLDSLELYPNSIPDLSSESPLIVSGRFHGNFPESCKASGVLPDMSNFIVDLKVQKPKGMPLDRVLARRQIDILTSRAWLTESKELEEKVAKMSIQTGVPSEYSHMILVQTDKEKQASDSVSIQEKVSQPNGKQIIFLRKLGIGFGNLVATAENRPPCNEEIKLHETSEIIAKAAARCCSIFLDRCCCSLPYFPAICPSWRRPNFFDPASSSSQLQIDASKMTLQFVPMSVKLIVAFLFFCGVSLPLRCSGDGRKEKERTLAIIKPDGLAGNYTDKIREIILDSGFSISKEMVVQLDEDTVKSFYAEHSSRSFFQNLVKYMTSGPVLVMVLEKENAVADWRGMIGPTDARNARVTHPHSIRAMCGLDSERNCVHGSDSPDSAGRETSFFFEDLSSVVSKHDEL